MGQAGIGRPVEMLNNSRRYGFFSWPFDEFEWRLSRWLLAHDVLIPPGVNLPPLQATARFVLEEHPHQPLCPPTLQPPPHIQSVVTT